MSARLPGIARAEAGGKFLKNYPQAPVAAGAIPCLVTSVRPLKGLILVTIEITIVGRTHDLTFQSPSIVSN